MRVISTAPSPRQWQPSPATARAARLEASGLFVCSVVILLGLCFTYWGRLQQLAADTPQGNRLIQL
jgi:hypothetical protein